MHPGQWLYEEGMVYWHGLDFKMRDVERGQLMIEASASAGFPMAVAHCHYHGWNGLKEDEKKAFDMCVKIEKETNGYHCAQNMVGICYFFGLGVAKNVKKAFEYYSLSAEQGNSRSMCNLGYCYANGCGTEENKTIAFEWHEKSADLGYCVALYNVGVDYETGEGVTEDAFLAQSYYMQAAAQGYEGA